MQVAFSGEEMRVKICVISNLFPPHIVGGYEILCQQAIQALGNRGHDILVLTSGHGMDPDVPAPAEPGIRRILNLEQPADQMNAVDPKRRIAITKHNGHLCREVLNEFQPHVVFIWNQRHITLGPALAAQDMGFPTVFYLCDEHLVEYMPKAPSHNLLGALADRLWRKDSTTEALNLGHALCISRTLRETSARAGLPLSHAQVNYPGIQLSKYPLKNDVGSVHHPARLLYLGPLRPNKRIEIIIRCLGMLLEDERYRVSLTIAGDGDPAYVESVQRVAEDLGISDELLLMGRLDYAQISSLYQSHDVFVYASTWDEPFGMTHLEAMASGLPIVSTDCGGPTEYLIHEENSLIVEKDNPRRMTESIGRLLHNAVLRRRLAENARRLVEAKFDTQQSMEQMENYLKKVARKEVVTHA